MTLPWPYLWPYVMSRLLGLLSLAILATGLWFVIDWVETDLRGRFWLVAGLVLLAAALFGRVLVLMGLRRGGPEARPQAEACETLLGAGGSRLYVEGFGPRGADPIVLTCGWGFDRQLWSGVVEQLKDRFRVLVWDPPGAGRSGRPFDDLYSAERFAGDLGAVLALTDGRPALLVGHGLGALAVLELFRNGPPKGIAGVALLNAAAPPPDVAAGTDLLHALRRPVLKPLLQLDVWLSPLVRVAAWASYFNGAAHLVARSAAFGADPPREAVDRAAFMAVGQVPSVQARALSAALDGPAEDAGKVTAPLLVVAGGRDCMVDATACQRTAETAPDGDYLMVEEVGHAGPLEAPADYAAAIDRLARKAFGREIAPRPHAESLRAQGAIMLPPEPRSWVADEDDRDERGGDGPGDQPMAPS